MARGISLNLDGSNRERFRPGINGLTTKFEPPFPVIDRKILNEENSPCEYLTMDPDLEVLDAQGRPEDRAAMLEGAHPSTVAASRKRRKGRTESGYSEKSDLKEGCIPAIFTVGGCEAYEVDQILDKRIEKGQTEYQIKWKGFNETTWEPPNCLTAAKELVNKYNTAHRTLKRSKH